MKAYAIDDAYELARRFMERIDNMRQAERENHREYEGKVYYYPSPKHRGAVRRISMELTRALAEMRKPE
jgi:hypothetical protein